MYRGKYECIARFEWPYILSNQILTGNFTPILESTKRNIKSKLGIESVSHFLDPGYVLTLDNPCQTHPRSSPTPSLPLSSITLHRVQPSPTTVFPPCLLASTDTKKSTISCLKSPNCRKANMYHHNPPLHHLQASARDLSTALPMLSAIRQSHHQAHLPCTGQPLTHRPLLTSPTSYLSTI